MILYILFFFLNFFSKNLHGHCLRFKSSKRNTIDDLCFLRQLNDTIHGICLNCWINEELLSNEEIILENNCSTIKELHCIDLSFENIQLYENFTLKYINIINLLFDNENLTTISKKNFLLIRILNSTLDRFHFHTFQILNNVENRKFCCVRFGLIYQNNHTILHLDSNIQNMNLSSLQLAIYCYGASLSLDFIPNNNHQSTIDKLICKSPDHFVNTTTMKIYTTTNTTPRNFVMIVGVIGGGSLFPCFFFACCIYFLCKRNTQQDETDDILAKSITSDEIASTTSEDSIYL